MKHNKVLFSVTNLLLSLILVVLLFSAYFSDHAKNRANTSTSISFDIYVSELVSTSKSLYLEILACDTNCNLKAPKNLIAISNTKSNKILFKNDDFLSNDYFLSLFNKNQSNVFSINFQHNEKKLTAFYHAKDFPASISESIYSNNKLIFGDSVSNSSELLLIKGTSLSVSSIHSYYQDYYGVFAILIIFVINFYLYYSNKINTSKLKTQITDQTMSLTEANKELEAERDVFAEGPVLIIKWSSGRHWSVSYVSPNCQSIVGYSYGDFMGDLHYDQLIHPEDLQRIRDDIDNAIIKNNSTIDHREFRVSTADNGYIWVDSNTKIFLSNDGDHQMLSYLVDVNDKMDAFRGLRNQRLALDQATVLSSTDLDGIITYVNDRFCELSGYDREDLIGKSYSLLKSDTHNDKFFTGMWDTVSSGKIWAGDICNQNSKGQLYWSKTTIIPSLTEAGNIFEFQSIAFENTDTKNAEKQLVLQKSIAEKATEAKTHFLANMSHELRTPMNGLMGMASLLETTKLTEQQSKFVSGILSSAEHQLTILNNILDLSKMQSGHLDLEYIDFDLSELLLNVTTLFSPAASEKNITIGFIIDNNLNCIFVGDKSRIKQLVTNLVSNAIKFTESGSITIKLSLSHNYNGVCISIVDTGLGIPNKSIPKLFQKFTQVDETITRRFGGTGLGLSICKYITEGLGGIIDVKSVENQGSTFSIDIPLKNSDTSVTWPTISDDIDVLIVGENTYENAFFETILSIENISYKAISNISGYSQKKLVSYDVVIIVNNNDDDIEKNISLVSSDKQLAKKSIFIIGMGADPERLHKSKIRYLPKPTNSLSLLTGINNLLTNKQTKLKPKKSKKQSFKIKPNLRFLIVDDNASNREILDLIIKSFSGKSDLAHDGTQAIGMIEKSAYDLIFMDCHMPNMDGYQTIKTIRKMGIHTPIVMVTADIDKDVSDKANDAGANGLILKPISINEIKQSISDHCHISSSKVAENNTKPKKNKSLLNNDSLTMMIDLDKDTTIGIIENIISSYSAFKSESIDALSANNYELLKDIVHKFKGGALSFASPSLINKFAELETYTNNPDDTIDHNKLVSLYNMSVDMSDLYINELDSI